jgi:hypothetical protein
MAAKMSAEEKAVRDALAIVNADTGLAQAQAAIAGASSGQSTVSQGNPSDIDTSTALGKQTADLIKRMQGLVSTQEPEVISKASALGLDVDTTTGKLTPKAPAADGKTAAQLAEEAAAAKLAADKAIADANKPTLALDTFRATLGLIFGKEEVTKSYVSKLYSLTSGFYKTGSTVEEAMNLALYQAENENAIPEFTSRFAGLFALRDAKQKGAALTVPTIAEFFATEAKMGEVLNNAGLGDLATESFLGGIIGKNKSVNEVATLISDVFNTIDYAPKELKQSLSTYFPGVDRTAIAKAILTGPEGAQALSQKIKGISVMTAAQQYGMNVDLATATDIANRGYDYNTALTGYGQVAGLGRANTVAQFGGGQFTQEQAQTAVFMKNVNDLSQLSSLKNVEEARFQGSSGASKGAFSTQYLNKGSSAGQF